MPLRFAALSLLLLTGCVNIPDTYAPPIQRKPLDGGEARAFGHFAAMGDPNAEAYILKDISHSAESATWRWTGQRPELRFYLQAVEHLNFTLDYAIAESTFKETGPVTLSIFINGRLLDKVRHDKFGEQHFEKPVPPEMLKRYEVNLAAVEIDKVWVAPADGARLGFILIRAGFTQ